MSSKPAYHKWYGTARWKRLRSDHLYKNPLCWMCEQEGRLTPATIANHTIAHKGDSSLFWDANNLDSLCKEHHDGAQQSYEKSGKKVMAFDEDGWPIETESRKPPNRELFFPIVERSIVPLTLVYGPPAAGKSTYVVNNKMDNDIVIDLDTIKKKISGIERDFNWHTVKVALRHRNSILMSLSKRIEIHNNSRAWFITTCQTKEALEHWKSHLKPETIIMCDEPFEILSRRVFDNEARRKQKDVQLQLITEWKANHNR